MGTGSAAATASWVLFGGLLAIGLGVAVGQSNSVGLGFFVAVITVGWTLAAWWRWRCDERTHPVPAAEYFAAVWALVYLSVLALPTSGRGVDWVNAMFVFPPVSVLPLVARTLLRDDGDPHGRARSFAYHLHRVVGWTLTALGGYFVISLFFIFVAPVPLIPGLLNLYAASRYRLVRSMREPTDTDISLTG